MLPVSVAYAQIAFKPCGDTNELACGHLTVPLDQTGQGSASGAPETITLAMRRHLSPVGNAKDAVIALAGGPGQAAIPFAEQFVRLLGPILSTRDLIVFDQRGIGLSHPLSCAAFEHLAGMEPSPKAVGICGSQIGDSRGLYTTADTVADIEAIRQAGGYEKLVLYGTSYGTKVAERYAQTYPDRVEALVLDSVVTLNGPDPLDRNSFAALRRVLRQLCARRGCERITREPVGDAARLVKRMKGGSLRTRVIDGKGRTHSVRVSAQDLLETLYVGDFDPLVRTEFPAAVRSALRGDTAALGRMIVRASSVEKEEESLTEGFDTPLFFATSCEEQAFPFNRSAPPAMRLAQAGAATRALPAGTFAPFTASDELTVSDIRDCAYWPFRSLTPGVSDAPLPNAPTLILSGEEDIRTPTANAREVAAEIPDAKLLVVPETGHSVLSSSLSGCPHEALEAFFAKRAVKPCKRPSLPHLLTPVAPRALSEVSAAGGARGRPGRTLHAVMLTLKDVQSESGVSLILRLGGRNLLGLVSQRFGGLRAGWAKLSGSTTTVHGYSYVPGVTVSGTLERGHATLRVSGAAAAHGALRAGRDGRLSGTLGGRRVSARSSIGLL